MFVPAVVREADGEGGTVLRLGLPLLDDYLAMVAARARPNTVLAVAFDLKVFFEVVGKDPDQVDTPRTCWRSSGHNVLRDTDPRWCGSRTVRPACRLGRSSAAWPASPGYTSIC